MEYLALITLVPLFFSPTLFFGYVVDDIEWQRKMKFFWKIRDRKPLAFWKKITYGCTGACPLWVDHLITITLHTLNCLCICYLFGYMAAIIYAVHPTNHQISIWLNGRRYQLSIFLSLISIINPYVGFIAYPLALWIHPISAPAFILSAVINLSYIPLLWLIIGSLFYGHIEKWTKNRFKIQDNEIFQKFEWGKITLSIKCLALYWYDALIPFNIKMFQPQIWGMELTGNRKRMYDLNVHFWLSIAFLSAIHVGVWLVDSSSLKWAILFDLCLFQWLPIWKNPVQLYANRYSGLAMVFYGVLFVKLFYSIAPFLVLYLGMVTLKDMHMYRDVYAYMFSQIIRMEHNMPAHWYAMNGFHGHVEFFLKKGNAGDAYMNDCYGKSVGFMWCLNNSKYDMIHDALTKKIQRS